MEDEYICVDNLQEHLEAASDFPSPGAFYGVCNFSVYYITTILLKPIDLDEK